MTSSKILIPIFLCLYIHGVIANSRVKRHDTWHKLRLPNNSNPLVPLEVPFSKKQAYSIYLDGISCNCTISESKWKFHGLGEYKLVRRRNVVTATQVVSYVHTLAPFVCWIHQDNDPSRSFNKQSDTKYTGQIYPTPTDILSVASVPIVFTCSGSSWVKVPQNDIPHISYLVNIGKLPASAHEILIMLFSKLIFEAQAKIEKGFNIGVWAKHQHVDMGGPYRCSEEPEIDN